MHNLQSFKRQQYQQKEQNNYQRDLTLTICYV
jgi:hypothetical protein